MMKYAIIIIVLTATGLVLELFIKYNSVGAKEPDKNVKTESFDQKIENRIIELEFQNEMLIIDDLYVHWGNRAEKFKISELSHALYFYFPQDACPPCIEHTITLINKVMPDYKTNDNMIFISPDYSKQYEANSYGKEVLYIASNKINIPLERENIPFFFTIDKNLRIKDVHVVNKNDFSRTHQYLIGKVKTLN